MSDKTYNPRHTKEHRHILRKDSTPQERILWARLRDSRLGHKFRRQHGIGGYIADFYCAAKKLVIEIDGAQHYEPEEMEYDMHRTAFFQDQGRTVLRFSNAEINTNINGVLIRICEALNSSS